MSAFPSTRLVVFRGHLLNFNATLAKKLDLDPIWARLLGWSQLSNPSDLPCYFNFDTSYPISCSLIKQSLTSYFGSKYFLWVVQWQEFPEGDFLLKEGDFC